MSSSLSIKDHHRTFRAVQMERGGHPVRGWEITCGRCGHSTAEYLGRLQNTTPRDAETQKNKLLTRKFEGMGWRVATRNADDRCPHCLALAKNSPTEKPAPLKELTALKSAVLPTLTPSEEAPRAMDIEDRRLVFAAVNDVYLGPDKGYAGDHSDASIAKSLDCPRAWVTKVREEFFGPIGGNEQLVKQITEANAALEAGRAMLRTLEDAKKPHTDAIAAINRGREDVVNTMNRLAGVIQAVR